MNKIISFPNIFLISKNYKLELTMQIKKLRNNEQNKKLYLIQFLKKEQEEYPLKFKHNLQKILKKNFKNEFIYK